MARLAACVALALSLAACVTDGTRSIVTKKPFAITGDAYNLAELPPGYHPPLNTTEGSLWSEMDKAERNIKTGGTVVRDPELQAYIRGIECRLAGPYCPDIRVYVMRVPNFNAMMAPNGLMQVWSGLLVRVRNEAQLAAVLGHETGHYLRRHSIKGWLDKSQKADAMVFFQMAMASVGVPQIADLANLVAAGSIFAFSRDQEREADEIGLRLMAQHGYDPREAHKIWDRLTRELKANKDHEEPSLFTSTHPPRAERSQTLDTQAKLAVPAMTSIEVDEARYQAMISKHRLSFLRDVLRLRRYDEFLELTAILKEDGHDVGTVEFLRGEAYRLRRKDGDNQRALEAYQDAKRAGDAPPMVHRSLGRVYRRLGKNAESRAAFRRYLELVPGADDRQIIQSIVEQLS